MERVRTGDVGSSEVIEQPTQLDDEAPFSAPETAVATPAGADTENEPIATAPSSDVDARPPGAHLTSSGEPAGAPEATPATPPVPPEKEAREQTTRPSRLVTEESAAGESEEEPPHQPGVQGDELLMRGSGKTGEVEHLLSETEDPEPMEPLVLEAGRTAQESDDAPEQAPPGEAPDESSVQAAVDRVVETWRAAYEDDPEDVRDVSGLVEETLRAIPEGMREAMRVLLQARDEADVVSEEQSGELEDERLAGGEEGPDWPGYLIETIREVLEYDDEDSLHPQSREHPYTRDVLSQDDRTLAEALKVRQDDYHEALSGDEPGYRVRELFDEYDRVNRAFFGMPPREEHEIQADAEAGNDQGNPVEEAFLDYTQMLGRYGLLSIEAAVAWNRYNAIRRQRD